VYFISNLLVSCFFLQNIDNSVLFKDWLCFFKYGFLTSHPYLQSLFQFPYLQSLFQLGQLMLELRSCLNSLPIKSCKQNMMLSFINAPCSSKFCPFFNPGDKGGIDPLVLWERNKDPICAYFYKSFYALTLFKSCSHCFCRDSNMFARSGEKILFTDAVFGSV